MRIGILHIGAPAGGMNAATRIIARLAHSRGHTPLSIRNGFTGLVKDDVHELLWEDVRGWQTVGGSQLGTNREQPSPIPGVTTMNRNSNDESYIDTGSIAYHLQKNDIQSLILIGGFEGFTAQLTLTEARKLYPALCIPMVHIPATISNNCPGTDYSIGSDTALNVIVQACDSIRLSANALRKRVFVVEVQGGNCGYLTTLSALTVGATSSYIPEMPLTLATLTEDVAHLKKRYSEEMQQGISYEGRVILRAENVIPEVYTTPFISGMLRAEGKGLFDSRETVLGHLQQGDTPSPLDRIRATRLAVTAVDWLQKVMEQLDHLDNRADVPGKSYTTSDIHSCIVGIRGADIIATPITSAKDNADLKKRRCKDNWWMPLRDLIRVLGKREYQIAKI